MTARIIIEPDPSTNKVHPPNNQIVSSRFLSNDSLFYSDINTGQNRGEFCRVGELWWGLQKRRKDQG
jgi:hypothetical protein